MIQTRIRRSDKVTAAASGGRRSSFAERKTLPYNASEAFFS